MFKIIVICLILFLLYRIVRRVFFKKFGYKKRSTGARGFRLGRMSIFKVDLNPHAPTECILRDGRKFGADFKDKIAPVLCRGCACSYDFREGLTFEEFKKVNFEGSRNTDMGMMTQEEFKLYKSMILLIRKDLPEEDRFIAEKTVQSSKVSDFFKKKIKDHLLSAEKQ